MRVFFLIVVFVLTIEIHAQNTYRLNDASKVVDVGIEITCDKKLLEGCGPLKVSFYRKRSDRPFQTIDLEQTQMWDPTPTANIINGYDDQSIINFNDYNFDGAEDVAICDGSNGGYNGPSYRVYLYSKRTRRFAYSRAFTRMNELGLGMFETNTKKRMHYVFTKSGCCWHETYGFDVYKNKPRKVYELTEDAFNTSRGYVEVTTRKLINGKWRTWVKRVKYVPDK